MASVYLQLPLFEFERICKACGEKYPLDNFYLKDKVTGRRATTCIPCKLAYLTRWRSDHPTRNVDYKAEREANDPGWQARYWAEYYARNKECLHASQKAYRQAHPELIVERGKQSRIKRADKIKITFKRWHEKNRDRRCATQHRRAWRIKGHGGTHTAEEWQAVKAAYKNTCLMCGKREPEIKLTFDHVDPFGPNTIENCQPLCGGCNASKGQHFIDYRPAYWQSIATV